MDKQELDALLAVHSFGSVGEDDFLFGKNGAAGQYGFFPARMLSGNAYACRRWNLNNSTPVGEVVGSVEYLKQLPSLLGLGCYLVDDAHNRKKLDPTNHYKFADGTTAALDGSMGQYQFGWRTPFYIAIWREGNYEYIAAGLKPIPGRLNYRIPVASTSALGAGVMDRTGDKLCSLISSDARYRGGNGSAISSGTAHSSVLSQLGYPATNMGTSTFEAKAANRGTGWGAGWYWIETAISVLFYLIMGTKHCQASYNANKDANGLYQGGLGGGVSGIGSWEAFNGYYPVIPTSAAVSAGDGVCVVNFNVLKSDGSTHYTAPIPVFFGLKNPYGHLWRGKNRIVGVKQTDGSYKFFVAKSSLTVWNYQDTANMFEVGGWLSSNPGNWTYIKELNYTGLAGMPSVDGATSSTYFADGCYADTATSGFRSPLGSGYASSGVYGGLAYFHGNLAPSNADAYLSSPLCECAEDFDPRGKVYSD